MGELAADAELWWMTMSDHELLLRFAWGFRRALADARKIGDGQVDEWVRAVGLLVNDAPGASD